MLGKLLAPVCMDARACVCFFVMCKCLMNDKSFL